MYCKETLRIAASFPLNFTWRPWPWLESRYRHSKILLNPIPTLGPYPNPVTCPFACRLFSHCLTWTLPKTAWTVILDHPHLQESFRVVQAGCPTSWWSWHAHMQVVQAGLGRIQAIFYDCFPSAFVPQHVHSCKVCNSFLDFNTVLLLLPWPSTLPSAVEPPWNCLICSCGSSRAGWV